MSLRLNLTLLLLTVALPANAAHRALLVGINDYTASRVVPRPTGKPAPGRDWPDLSGAAGDANAMHELLTLVYGFAPNEIVTLTDQAATRVAILDAIERQLVTPAAKGDVVFFYFAGHGSQVRNSLSDEPDLLDESLVPADSRAGAADIRDKELRVLFNRILDRGAQLTVMLDNCHSGSGARGLPTSARPRGIKPDLRDVADPIHRMPRPEDRGALVLSAAQDFGTAWETRDRGVMHGTFSWAWMRSLREAASGEAALTTFLRAQARMRAETPFQDPVLAGTSDARLRPFLGERIDRRAERPVVAVERTRSDGTVMLQGGWANGLSINTELRVADAPDVRLTVTAIDGLGRSEARVLTPRKLTPGTLLEVAGWSAPPTHPLRVFVPHVDRSAAAIAAAARAMFEQAKQHRVQWVTNPLDVTPTHVVTSLDASAIANVPTDARVFAQLPAPAALVRALDLGAEFETTSSADDADYILAGRLVAHRLTYAWIRPGVRAADRRKTGLPLCSDWIAPDADAAPRFRDAALRLRTIHEWQLLESPPGAAFPYHLDLRRVSDDELPRDAVVSGGERYHLVLRAGSAMLAKNVRPRYLYVFVIDSFGRGVLLFPKNGSVENRFPLDGAPPEIELRDAAFEVAPPYGVDTYYLLSTDEPLPNPWILAGDAVRSRSVRDLALPSWSIERSVYESVSPQKAQCRVSPTAGAWSPKKKSVISVSARSQSLR